MAILLAVTVLLPLIVSLVLVFLPALDYRAARQIALAAVLMTLASSLVLLLGFRPELSEPQFTVNPGGHYGWAWIGRPDIRFASGSTG